MAISSIVLLLASACMPHGSSDAPPPEDRTIVFVTVNSTQAESTNQGTFCPDCVDVCKDQTRYTPRIGTIRSCVRGMPGYRAKGTTYFQPIDACLLRQVKNGPDRHDCGDPLALKQVANFVCKRAGQNRTPRGEFAYLKRRTHCANNYILRKNLNGDYEMVDNPASEDCSHIQNLDICR